MASERFFITYDQKIDMKQQQNTPRVIQRPYRNSSGDIINLDFDRTTGEAFLYGRWWDEVALRQIGILQQSITKPLPTPKPLPFGDPNKYEGRWRTTPPRGPKAGTGKFI